MSPNYEGTTSRCALIIGMTNTDQVGMWQARAPAAATIPDHAERLADAGDGTDPSDDDGGDVNEATGLTFEEQAAFDGMRTGDTPAGDPEPADGDPDPAADPDGEDADADAPGEAEPPAGGPLAEEKTAAELAADATAGKKPAPKTVSFGRYQRDVKKASDAAAAAQAEAQRARDDQIRLAERVALINEALSAKATPAVDPNAPPANPFEEEDIDPEVDYAASVKQIQRRQRFQNENQSRVEQDVTVSREDQQMRDTFVRDYQTASATDPNVAPAYQFLKDSRFTEICISEFDKDPNDPADIDRFTPQEIARAVQVFNAEEKYVVGNAIKQNKSPTAAIVRLAKARGFKPPAPAARVAASAAAAPAARTNGSAAPMPSAATELASLAAAKEAGKSLSDGGGAPPESGISAKMLLDMSPEAFEEFLEGLSPKEERQLNAILGRP